MKVSVIIPCYNFEQYIEQSILSVINQRTNFEYEILIRDDLSTDRSRENINRICICYGQSGDIKNFSETHEPNKNLGLSGLNNFKFLLSKAKGKYIAYLDGDDYWTDPYKLQKQIDYMDKNEDCCMTFTGHWQKNSDGTYEPSFPNCWLGLPGFIQNAEVKTEDFLNYNWAVYGRVFKNIEDIIKDWMISLPILDWPINYEFSKIGKVKYLDFAGGVYRIHNSSTYGNLKKSQQFEHVNKIRKIIREDYKKTHPDYNLESPIIGIV